MTDYHFKFYTFSIDGNKTRLYNWKTTRVMYPSPVILAILKPLVLAKGEVVSLDALISSAKGARLDVGAQGRTGAFASRQRPPASQDAIKQAASRLRDLLGHGSVEAVRRQGYRMGWAVRLGAAR